jgi:quercetin dioxygenase-like cupin family protein
MTVLTDPGNGPSFPYAGTPMHVLAGQGAAAVGFGCAEITIPPRFAGPIPHAHDEFDEALYVLRGRLRVWGTAEAQEAQPGSMFVAPRGHRHGFSNPHDEPALVLGLWSPAGPALAFMRDIGAALPPTGPPDPELMQEIYARHASRLLPDPPT